MASPGFDSISSSIQRVESSNGVGVDIVTELNHLGIGGKTSQTEVSDGESNRRDEEDEGGIKITCFSDSFNDVSLHYQIIRLPKQIYAWIGCNSAKFGRLYAAAPTRPNNTVSVTSLLSGASDNTGSGIARRIVLKCGLPVTLACNIPKDSPMLEAEAEKKLIQKLIALGYTKPKTKVSS